MSENIKYEAAIGQLEEITKKLEKGDMTLEDALKSFEKGISLARKCTKLLDQAEGKIQVLVKDMDGEIKLEDFEEVDEL